MKKNIDCILCPYKKEEDCYINHEKCYSLSNMFPFKQVRTLKWYIALKKEVKYNQKCDEKYGDSTLEDDDFKFIWGIKSWDDLCDCDANLYTMNDIDIWYDKERKLYILGVETAYDFPDYEAECNYLKKCLEAFGKYMDDYDMNKNKRRRLFFSNPQTNIEAETIEELYTEFRMFVNGYCSLN